ncbi:MAG TPA: DNA gyrase subunit A [Bryobacterales bacterium]|nr:DNA gyrase subunit A [Bryobacterales bacterium]
MGDAEKPPQPPVQLPLGGGGDGGDKSLLPIDIEDEMRKSYLDYAMSVIIGRALPDIRDGLKPVQRRILYGMHEAGLGPTRPYRKCANTVGNVMGNYHPHGDLPIYDALVRLAQPFSMRYPLIDGQGNFGSVDGDPPAAMRYTEARLARIATTLLDDIDKETVDFRPNYDDRTIEPEYLPALIPNLLINGAQGIAVGMATNIPPHNLGEIIDAAILVVQNPNLTLEKIMEKVPGPDFPTGGFILGRQGILDAYKTGRGHLKLRARAAIEHVTKDRDQIVVTEIPYQVNKAKLQEYTAQLVNDKKIEGIADIRDESDREGMRVVFELKRGEQPEVVLNNLYKHTQMQTGFGIIMLAIVNGQPREVGLAEALRLFVDHRIDIVRRRTDFLLRKAREREHILLGFRKALEHLDQVIKLIRASKTPAEARASLMERLEFTEKQAQAIIELQLQRLTGLERQKIVDELAEIQKKIQEYLEILGSEKILRSLLIKELREVQKDYADPRRTEIIEDTGEIQLEDLIADEDVAITVTHNGYLKRTAVDTYRKQARGGKGRIGMGTRTEDFVANLLIASTHSYVLIFTNLGRVYWLKVYEIPDAGTAGKGKNVVNLVNLQQGETVKAFLPVKEFTPGQYVVMITKNAVVKKCELTVFDNPMARGIIAMSMEEGDELIAARLTDGSQQIFLGTHNGKAIRFPEGKVRPMGRQAYGVRGMKLETGDFLVGMEAVGKEGLILTISENGYGKRTALEEYRITSRGGKGIINMKTTERNGKVVAILNVKESSDLFIITKDGKILRLESSEIREAGRSTQGVRLVKLEEGDRVAAASVIPEEEAPDNGTNGQGALIQ